MNRNTLALYRRTVSKALAPVAIAALPVVLLNSSLRTFHELDEQKAVYLRNRVAMVAGRLENLRGAPGTADALDILAGEEPGLVDLKLIGPREDAPEWHSLAPIWNGQELFRTEFAAGGRIFRAYVPFHSEDGLRIARIDLDAGTADFLVEHARHNVIVASVAGLVLVLLASYALWATRRAARLRVRQLEVEHLAHMGKMAAVLAHEIRNPLGTIKGFAQLAGEQGGGPLRELIDPILSETTRLEALVNDLLLYGRPPAPSLRKTVWGEVLPAIEADARHLIGDRPIRFQAERAGLEWLTDPHVLRQALLNLLRNAAEAIGDAPGEVRLRARGTEDGGVALSVIDDGPGISEDAEAKVFEPFFTTKAFGTGLGLPITRRLVESMGGSLTLKPATPRGTEAVIRFPGRAGEEDR